MLTLRSLSDEASVIPGALGLLPSSSLSAVPSKDKKTFGLHEPIGGSVSRERCATLI